MATSRDNAHIKQATISSAKTSFFGQDQHILKTKLKAALKYVIDTCVFGSSNKAKDNIKTNGWVCFQLFRYEFEGGFVKNSGQSSWKNDVFNIVIKNGKLDYQGKKWGYETGLDLASELETKTKINPLQNIETNKKEILQKAIKTILSRKGNCYDKCCLFAKYLWENHGGLIHRIELVKYTKVDHVFVVINRTLRTQLNGIWGHAFVVDPWHKRKGMIAEVKTFEEQKKILDEMEQYAIVQKQEWLDLGFPDFSQSDHFQTDQRLKISRVIFPGVDKYPVLPENAAAYSLEDFYKLSHEFPDDMAKKIPDYADEHHAKFAKCLKEIKKNAEEIEYMDLLQGKTSRQSY